jgi:hypothetical protein
MRDQIHNPHGSHDNMEFKKSEDQKPMSGPVRIPLASKHAGAKDGNTPLKKNKARAKARLAKRSRRANR